MNIAKHMEALFIAAAVLACSATVVHAAGPAAKSSAASAEASTQTSKQGAKRQQAQEKAGAEVQDSILASLANRFTL